MTSHTHAKGIASRGALCHASVPPCSAGSLAKMVRKALAAVPGLKARGGGRFFYPRYGFGQLSEAYYRAAQDAGARIHLNARVQSIETHSGGGERSAL